MSNFVDFWNFWISYKTCVPGEYCLLLPSVLPFVLIFSSCLIPICGVFPFGVFPFTLFDVFPSMEDTRAKPIMAHFLMVAFVLTIFCDEKYLKINLSGFTQLVWLTFKSDLFFVSISAFKP